MSLRAQMEESYCPTQLRQAAVRAARVERVAAGKLAEPPPL